MKNRKMIVALLLMASFLLMTSACGNIGQSSNSTTRDTVTLDSTSQNETMGSIPTQTAGALQPPYTPTFSSTPEILPTPTNILQPTPTPIGGNFSVLPSIVPAGARARLGRGVINQVAVSPDGKTLAVAGATGLSLFNLETFEEIWSVPTNHNINFISFSSDGKTLISLSIRWIHEGYYPNSPEYLDAVCLWDASNGQLKGMIPIYDSGEHGIAIAFSPDGQFLAVGRDVPLYDYSVAVNLWDLRSGQLYRTLADDGLLSADNLTFSSDGKTLVVGSRFGTIIIWDYEKREVVRRFEDIEEDHAIALSPSGELLAVGNEKVVDLFNVADGERLFRLEGIGDWITSLAFSSDGKMLAAGDDKGNVIQWDPESGHCLRVHKDLGGETHGVVFSPDGKLLVTALAGGIHVWNAADGRSLHIVEDPFSNWEETKYLSDGKELSLRTGGKVVLLDPSGNANLSTLEFPDDAIWSPDYLLYASFSPQNKIVIKDTESGRIPYQIRTPEYMHAGFNLEVQHLSGRPPQVFYS
jgi:WD40 repeat protein